MKKYDSILNFLNELSDDVNIDTDIENLDLTKEEDYKKFKKYISECRELAEENNIFDSFFSMFCGLDMKELLDTIEEIGDTIFNEAQKKEENKVQKVPELPSKSTPLDKQQQMHNVVGQYVDEYIRPYGNMKPEVVDDVYAGLFEFACWVMNRG